MVCCIDVASAALGKSCLRRWDLAGGVCLIDNAKLPVTREVPRETGAFHCGHFYLVIYVCLEDDRAAVRIRTVEDAALDLLGAWVRKFGLALRL